MRELEEATEKALHLSERPAVGPFFDDLSSGSQWTVCGLLFGTSVFLSLQCFGFVLFNHFGSTFNKA